MSSKHKLLSEEECNKLADRIGSDPVALEFTARVVLGMHRKQIDYPWLQRILEENGTDAALDHLRACTKVKHPYRAVRRMAAQRGIV